MQKINIHKASPIEDPVPDLVIEVGRELPYSMNFLESGRLMMADAVKLEQALYGVLPGGTYDRLLGKLLERKSSHFIVSFGDRYDRD